MTYERKGTLVNKKFYQFLMPSILSTIAISLNEFVDSIIVSRLLGNDAMSMVNMGFPLMLAYAVVYTLLGVGGSVVYSKYMGKQKTMQAERLFTMTFVFSAIIAVVFLAVGLVFLQGIGALMCEDTSLLPEFLPYLKVLVFSSILIIPIQVLITFLPAFDRPGIGTAVNITANAVNLLMDYIFIHFFDTGLKGAAYATLTGYTVGALLVIVFILIKKVKIPVRRFGLEEIRAIPKVCSCGIAPALNQFGYCVKIYFFNYLTMKIAGIDGVTVFALCMQVVSMVSVIISGIVNAVTPIAATLRGMGDANGIRLVMRMAIKVQFIANAVSVLILELWPQIVLYIYKIEPDIADMAALAVRIFSVMFIFRGFIFIYMYYYQIISRKVYAIVLGLIDGFVGLIPLSLILTPIMGINGVWLTFPLLSFLMLAGIVIINLIIVKKSNGKYQGLLLTECEDMNAKTVDLTIPLHTEDIVRSSRDVREFCHDNGLTDNVSGYVSSSLEEMATYTVTHCDVDSSSVMDVIIKIRSDYVTMDIMSFGKPFDFASAEGERYANIERLKGLATSVDFGYILGMNRTHIKVLNATN